jgi:tetratricopeptide (TPR) repeat protein
MPTTSMGWCPESAQPVTLLGAGDERLVTRPTESLDAYEQYVKGRYYRFTQYNVPKARECFATAARLNPDYAAAHAALAETLGPLSILGLISSREALQVARPALERALRLDGGLSDAHAATGMMHMWLDWRWDDAEEGFRRALAARPSDIEARAQYSHLLAVLGRTEESLKHSAIAQESTPSPRMRP